jgi:hypothetical protein
MSLATFSGDGKRKKLMLTENVVSEGNNMFFSKANLMMSFLVTSC